MMSVAHLLLMSVVVSRHGQLLFDILDCSMSPMFGALVCRSLGMLEDALFDARGPKFYEGFVVVCL